MRKTRSYTIDVSSTNLFNSARSCAVDLVVIIREISIELFLNLGRRNFQPVL